MVLSETRVKQMILTAAAARAVYKSATIEELKEAILRATAAGRGSVLKVLEPELDRRLKKNKQ